MAERGLLAFIPGTICLEANSNVKREMRISSATAATRSKSESSLTAAFPLPFFSRKQWTGHGGKESRTRARVGYLTHYRRGLKEVRTDYNNSHYCVRFRRDAE